MEAQRPLRDSYYFRSSDFSRCGEGINKLDVNELAFILSRLTIKDAAAARLVSPQWARAFYMYFSRISMLNFKWNEALLYFCNKPLKSRHRESHNYVDWVNNVLEKHDGGKIKQFSVCFDLDCRFTSSIDRWIQFAMEREVEELELEFLLTQGHKFQDSYIFPHQLLGISHLSGPGCHNTYPPRWEACEDCITSASSFCRPHLDLPTGGGFKCLKVLHLENVDVDGQVVEYFLSNCRALEGLSITGAIHLLTLTVAAPSAPSLRYLVVKNCLRVTSITICNSHLCSFIYKGMSMHLQLDNVPSLVEVCLHQADSKTSDFAALAFDQLSSHLFQLHTLMLDVQFNAPLYLSAFACAVPKLPNLQHLDLVILADDLWSLRRLAAFLRASPHLKKLVLQLQFYPIKGELYNDVQCPHDHLRVVEIVGYRVSKKATQHLMFLIENAAALEKVVIDPACRWLHHRTGAYRSFIEVKEEGEARDHAMLQLKEIIPPTVEFVCL
ncbi:uncharacterized protein LOC112176185 isoform X2 [Rosa chinensis]|uniref:uncharacterized protein LOC112176185 isoform X2 n=1 Tax=Rosa chinensis TaxID=74649 RepID=UPI000D086BA1|nr:uncharacterized protein LOC112176185 isoform X2 [Rosa chinensis]